MPQLKFLVASVLLFAVPALGSEQIGTIVFAQGDVTLLTNPGPRSEDGPPPRTFFEGEYFTRRQAKAGDRFEKGNYLRTRVGGRARVVFPNGDQFYVGPGTSYRLTWKESPKITETQVEMHHGRLRAIISKNGARNRLRIRTSTTSMGVRGTDFMVEDNGTKGAEVLTLRGAVEMLPHAKNAKSIEVLAGMKGSIRSGEDAKLRKASKADYRRVEEITVADQGKNAPEDIQALEELARKATVNDIIAYDASLSAEELLKADSGGDLNLKLVERMRQRKDKKKGQDPHKADYEKHFGD